MLAACLPAACCSCWCPSLPFIIQASQGRLNCNESAVSFEQFAVAMKYAALWPQRAERERERERVLRVAGVLITHTYVCMQALCVCVCMCMGPGDWLQRASKRKRRQTRHPFWMHCRQAGKKALAYVIIMIIIIIFITIIDAIYCCCGLSALPLFMARWT